MARKERWRGQEESSGKNSHGGGSRPSGRKQPEDEGRRQKVAAMPPRLRGGGTLRLLQDGRLRPFRQHGGKIGYQVLSIIHISELLAESCDTFRVSGRNEQTS